MGCKNISAGKGDEENKRGRRQSLAATQCLTGGWEHMSRQERREDSGEKEAADESGEKKEKDMAIEDVSERLGIEEPGKWIRE